MVIINRAFSCSLFAQHSVELRLSDRNHREKTDFVSFTSCPASKKQQARSEAAGQLRAGWQNAVERLGVRCNDRPAKIVATVAGKSATKNKNNIARRPVYES